jgi:hypothetical protein
LKAEKLKVETSPGKGLSMKRLASHPPIRRWLLTVCIALAWLVTRAAPVAACSPPGNPWFNEHVTLDTRALPPELSVTVGDGIEITAPPNTQLYILRTDGEEEWVPRYLTEDATSGKDQYLREGHLHLSSLYLQGFNHHQQYGDGRPEDIAIPPTQHVTLTLRYGAETFSVPITLSYSLNGIYEPGAVKRFSDMCATHQAPNQARSMTAYANAPRPTPIGGSPRSAGEQAGVALLLVLGVGLWITAGVLAWRWRQARRIT